ncbi:MAG: class I SAM-dependent methyltransferase [Pseudomonadales bacterium]
MSDKSYEGWDTNSHLEVFDFWNNKLDFYFNYLYGCFTEQHFLISSLQKLNNSTLLDVGCATGTTFRFIKNKLGKNHVEYTGIDFSEPALNRAKKLYPSGKFVKVTDEKFSSLFDKKFDVVFSRDTIMHQTDPKRFISDLISVAKKVLIIRLRTRDKGNTEYNVEKSCQMHYDKFWMPYIVMNIDEVIDIFSTTNNVCKITVNKSREVLGGHNLRFLPKELYFSEAGGAETSIMIEFNEGHTDKPEIVIEESPQGREYISRNKWKNYSYAAANKILKKFV